jgi:hypothetical protein
MFPSLVGLSCIWVSPYSDVMSNSACCTSRSEVPVLISIFTFVGIHEDLISTENTSIRTECEIEWLKVKLKNNKDLHIASFYMPHRNIKDLESHYP